MMVIDKQLLVERLTQRMDLDRIFLFSYSFLDKPQHHLVLVMKPEDGVSPKVMKPVVELCLIDMSEVSFELILFGEWRNRIRHGSLYYAYASLPKHEVYASSRKKTKSLSVREIGGVIELSEQWFLSMTKTGEEFREGATKFAENDNYLKATFMIHQSLESFLRLPQMMVQGKVNNIHHLENRLRSLSSHFPGFRTVLLSNAFIETETFKLLDKSFQAVKQHKDMEITAFDASYLYDKCCEISKAIEILYQFFLGALKAEQQTRLEEAGQQTPSEEEKKKTKPVIANAGGTTRITTHIMCEDFSDFPWPKAYKDDVNTLLDKIRRNHNPEQISMLNYHTGGFSGVSPFRFEENEERAGVQVELYLVVLMKNTGPFTFKTMQVGVASAMVVFLDLKYVEKGLAEGNRFIHTVWTKGRVLRRKSTFKPVFALGNIDWEVEYSEVRQVIDMTKHVIGEIRDSLESDDLDVEINYCILKSIFEAVVISYLRCVVGYVPKDIPLRQLIDWTGVNDRQLIEFLYPKSELEQWQLELFLHPEKMWTKYKFDALYADSFLETKRVKRHLNFFEKLLDSATIPLSHISPAKP